MIVTSLVLGALLLTAGVVSEVRGEESEGRKGITVEDLGRGLKSAAKNIEKEIPKIGPAIADTAKKLSGKGSKSSGPDDEKSSK